jgi:2-polyprenyl-3-methyl-5-hydroxy-6-metoxy-1,4-benzoquinol methylase
MNWAYLRHCAWLDTRARFVAATPRSGSLLDLGSSDGATLGHIAELRPDLKLFASDIAGCPENYPQGCEFQRADFEHDKLRWPDGSMDAITCMQLVEHLHDLSSLLKETVRLLKPGGRVFFETPHPKTLSLSSPPMAAAGTFTLNFYDDRSHTKIVPMGALAAMTREVGLIVEATGISRNWLFAASHPFFQFLPPSRKKFTALTHWLGWSAFLVASRQK